MAWYGCIDAMTSSSSKREVLPPVLGVLDAEAAIALAVGFPHSLKCRAIELAWSPMAWMATAVRRGRPP